MILTKRKIKNYIIAIFSFSLFFFLQNTPIYSSDFNISSSLNIYLENVNDNFVTVEEILEIKVSNPNYYIPKDSQHTVLAKKDETIKNTLEITNRHGREKSYSLEEKEDSFEIVIINQSNITENSPFFAKIRYQTQEFVNQNGNITNLYLPGLSKDVKFEDIDSSHDLKTKYSYFLSYHVPENSPQASYITPESIAIGSQKSYRTYSLSQKDRIGNTGWIQLGQEQYYYFKITQTIPRTDFLTPESLSKHTNWLSTNILEIAIPREFAENNQEVFIKKITPEPKKIHIDDEGNVVGIFEIDANRNEEVVIEGYIKLSKSIKEIPDFEISEYKTRVKELGRLETYTQPDKYWESDNKEMLNVANKLVSESGNSSILNLIRNNYNFVIETLEYSKEKAEGQNIRVGALKALQGAKSVCMEYADLMIAILRAQGIPSRAAFGYGNDPLITDSTREIGHQWVQIWIPDYGWLSVDPTWGETGREYIGGDLDHILWYTVGDSQQNITDFAIYTADTIDIQELEFYDVSIEAFHKSNVPDLAQLETISDITLRHASQEDDDLREIEYVLKTTMFGRILIFVIPVIILLLSISIFTILISKILKSRKK